MISGRFMMARTGDEHSHHFGQVLVDDVVFLTPPCSGLDADKTHADLKPF